MCLSLCRFRIPRCIQQARLHMHMWAMDNITARSKIAVDLANLLINIRFDSIDKVFDGNCPSLASDAVFVGMSDLCSVAFAEEFEQCKQRVKVWKALKRRKGRAPPGDDEGEGEEEEEEAELEMPLFEPPVMVSVPTYIDWDCEDTRNMFLQLTMPDLLDKPAEMLRMLEEHVKNHPGTVQMHGFPITNMVAYIDPTMLLPHSGALLMMQEWLIENKECALPDQMTMCVLVMMHQKRISSRSIFSKFMQTQDAMPRNILTLSDLRQSFLTEDDCGRKMMYRCGERPARACVRACACLYLFRPWVLVCTCMLPDAPCSPTLWSADALHRCATSRCRASRQVPMAHSEDMRWHTICWGRCIRWPTPTPGPTRATTVGAITLRVCTTRSASSRTPAARTCP